MKNIARVLLLGLLTISAQAQNPQPPPEWKVTLQVVDETEQPVQDAEAKVAYHVKPPPGQSTAMDRVVGHTDAEGYFTATGRAQYKLYCSAT
jgi:hypothetical protein